MFLRTSSTTSVTKLRTSTDTRENYTEARIRKISRITNIELREEKHQLGYNGEKICGVTEDKGSQSKRVRDEVQQLQILQVVITEQITNTNERAYIMASRIHTVEFCIRTHKQY